MTYLGSVYCVGYTYGVPRTLYGVGTRIVLQGVSVDSVNRDVVEVSGFPSCGPGEWCGQTAVTISVTFGTAPPLRPGDVINLYGTTTTGGLTPSAFQVVGFCNPDFGC